jgi:pimeloyl-ACP methyl ester carboxylesterase
MFATINAMETTLDGRRLAYDDAGQGVPCVLLHAFPLDRRMFADLPARLGARARVIAPDLRGFGGSELGGPFSIADLADDVARLLDHLKLERAVVGGVSMGGYVALAFAARHGRRLLGLMLADTKASPDGAEVRSARDEAIALVEALGVTAYLDKQLPKLLSGSASDAVRTAVRTMGAQTPQAVIAALHALRDRPDRQGELGAIDRPTLVVVGTEDVVTPPTEAAAMATAIRKAVLVEIPDAGHLANLEQPTPFSQALSGFLARTGT